MLRLLWTRQRKLTNIELVTCDKGVDSLVEEIGQDPTSFHEHATSLRITDVGTGTIPGIVTQLLQLRPINSLTLDFWLFRSNLEYQHPQYLDDVYDKGELIESVFAPSQDLKPTHSLKLKELVLHAIDLTHCVDVMLAALDTSVMKSLKVTCCLGTDKLFSRMSKISIYARPQLRLLYLYHEQYPDVNPVSNDDPTDRTIQSVGDLLLSTTDTVEKLWIIMRGRSYQGNLLGPLGPGIMNHGSCLLRLTVDVRGSRPPYEGEQRVGWFSPEALEQVCARMEKLELLYIPFPPVVANGYLDHSFEFGDYMVWILLRLRIPIPLFTFLNNLTIDEKANM